MVFGKEADIAVSLSLLSIRGSGFFGEKWVLSSQVRSLKH